MRQLLRQRRWLAIAAVLCFALLATVGTYELMNARTVQLCGHLVSRVATTEKVVALTFDDGPDAHTGDLIRVLAEKRVRGTFFVIGSELRSHPQEGRALVAAGHELGNHTFDHRRMVFVTPATVAAQVESTDAEIRAAGYTGPISFRPPFGKKLVALPCYLAAHDRTTIMWDIEPDSGRQPSADQLVRQVTTQVRPGSIVLLHPWSGTGAQTRAALPLLIDRLRSEGYRFVTIDELVQ